MINVILQFFGLDLFNIKLAAKFYQNIPNDSRVKFHFFQIWTSAKPQPIPNVIWQSHGLHLVNIPMCMQNFITIFHSVKEIGPFSLFQNLALGKASTDDKCHFAISWARSCQYQCVCKIFKIFQFKSYQHFSRTGRWQNLHKQSKNKIFTNCPVTKSNVWL